MGDEVLEQLTKDFDLSQDEIEAGWVDGRDDGGIDGIFILINGHLLQDPITFTWPRRHAELEIVIVTCKHHATFQQAPLDTIVASISELFDLGLERVQLRGAYCEELLSVRSLLHSAYRRLSTVSPNISFRFVYASRGDAGVVGDSIRARANQIVATTRSLFSSCSAVFEFIGAAELMSLYRKTKRFALDLPFLEHLSREQNSHVVLVLVDEYCKFVVDEQNALRRYLFDSNVRDHLGGTRVNEDIVASLQDVAAPDFWWLNNGVTILATAAVPVGKMLRMQDIQIVNGLQTTESIFRYSQAGVRELNARAVLVKVIVSTDADVRDRIIQATNNQNVVELASLRATDKIQRDVEEILERHGWFYERRKNYYRNIGKPPARFVTPLYLSAGFVSLVMKNPAAAARLRSRFMQNEDSYRMVFSDRTPIDIWPQIVEVLKRVEEGLDVIRQTKEGERFNAKWRGLIALLVVAKILGTFDYSHSDLLGVVPSAVTKDIVIEIWAGILQARVRRKELAKSLRSNSFILGCCCAAASMFGLSGIEVVGRRGAGLERANSRTPAVAALTEEFIQSVNSALPPQPWKLGTHVQVASQLGADGKQVSAAIQELIHRGNWNRQRDGVVYGPDGSVIATDPGR